MYPVTGSPPEFIPKGEDRPPRSEALPHPDFSPWFSAGGSASQEEPDLHNPTEPVLQRSSFVAPQTQVSATPSPFGELNRNSTYLDQQNRHSDQYLFPSLIYPEQAQIQNAPQINLQPAFLPSPMSLNTFSPAGEWLQNAPTPMQNLPFPPLTPSWSNMRFLSPPPPPMFGFSPCMLVPNSSPGGFYPLSPFPIRPYSLPSRWPCSQTVPVHQTYSPPLISNNTELTLLNITVRPPSATNEQQVQTQEEQRKVLTPDKTEAKENHRKPEIKEVKVSPGPLGASDKKLKFEPCEDCSIALRSLCSEITEDVEADESETTGTLEVGNDSFREYLDELCSDENFVRNVNSILGLNRPSSFCSFDQKAQLETAVWKDSDPLPVKSERPPTPGPDETLQFLNLDPLSRKLEANVEDSQEKSWRDCPPLVGSHLLEEPADSSVNSSFSSHKGKKTHFDICSIACPYCRFLLDSFSTSDHVPLTERFSDSLGPQGGPSDEVTSELKTGEEGDGQSRQQKKEKRAKRTKKLTTVSAGEREKKASNIENGSLLRVSLVRCTPKPEGEKDTGMVAKPENRKNQKNPRKRDESIPKRISADFRKHEKHLSGRRQLFVIEESEYEQETCTPEKEQSNKCKDLKENMQEFRVGKGKPVNFCREMVEDERFFSKPQTPKKKAGKTRKTKNTATEGGETKKESTQKRKLETNTDEAANEPESLPVSSPMKRCRQTNKSGEKAEKKPAVPKVKASGNKLEGKAKVKTSDKCPKSEPSFYPTALERLEKPEHFQSKVAKTKSKKCKIKPKPELMEDEEGDRMEPQASLMTPLKKNQRRGTSKGRNRKVLESETRGEKDQERKDKSLKRQTQLFDFIRERFFSFTLKEPQNPM